MLQLHRYFRGPRARSRPQGGLHASSDAFPSHEFDFMLSNPSYGKSGKSDLDRLGGKKHH